MYKQIESVNLVCYASPINNNLAISGDGMLSVARYGYVSVIPVEQYTMRRSKFIACGGHGSFPQEHVTQTGWMELFDEDYLVILSSLGMQVYNPDGSSVIYSHRCKDSSKEGYASGLYFYNNYLCVGNNIGQIRIFEFSNITYNQVYLRKTRLVHDGAILWIAGSGDIIASSSADKTIAVHDISRGKINTLHSILPSAECSSLVIAQDVMYAATSNGNIHIYDFIAIKTTKNSPMLLMEVKAHDTNITGMSYAENMLLTVSSDGWIKIWESQKDTVKLENIFQLKIIEAICGASFESQFLTRFYVAIPESTEVKVFEINRQDKTPHIVA